MCRDTERNFGRETGTDKFRDFRAPRNRFVAQPLATGKMGGEGWGGGGAAWALEFQAVIFIYLDINFQTWGWLAGRLGGPLSLTLKLNTFVEGVEGDRKLIVEDDALFVIRIRIRIFIYPQPLHDKKLYMLIYVVKNAPLVVEMICYVSALERTFAKKMTYGEMQVEERIARIGSGDPGSHLGIPISHISARI